MSDFLPHQISASDRLTDIIKQHGAALLYGAPRSGKSRTAFRVINSLPIKHALILTKKNAIEGLKRESFVCTKRFTIINYESAHKVDLTGVDFVWADESHVAGGGVGKPSARYKALKAICWDKPLLLTTATPYAETMNSAYYQFGLSKYTPLKYKSFYRFFDIWGVRAPIYIQGRAIESYKKSIPELEAFLEPYTVKMTQLDAGIAEHIQAEDVLHTIKLTPDTMSMLETLKTDLVVPPLVCESEMQLRTYLHQAEAGAIMVDGRILELPDTSFVDYIRQTFGDTPDVACMCHFQATRWKVAKYLPNVKVFSSNAAAEGVDLSHFTHIVVVNHDYSGAKFTQRRERGININMTEKRHAHFLVAEGCLSHLVYKAVSKKHSFTLSHFRNYLKNGH